MNPPNEVRLLMIDPKALEFPLYNGIPHLVGEVITDVEKAIEGLSWAVREMERRKKIIGKAKNRDIQAYNQAVSGPEKLPYIVLGCGAWSKIIEYSRRQHTARNQIASRQSNEYEVKALSKMRRH